MGKMVGMDCIAYYDATPLTGLPSTGTWLELDNVKDITLNLSTGEADVTTRANNGWKASLPTLKEGSVDFEMLWDTTDAGFSAIQNAWDDGDEIALAFMDGDIDVTGAEGLAGNFVITDLSRSEPLDGAVSVKVVAKPSSYTVWYVVSTS